MNILEVLYAARASLANKGQPFNFSEWNHCTCGHIYFGVNESFDQGETSSVSEPNYREAIAAVATALGWRDRPYKGRSALHYISDFTKVAYQLKTGINVKTTAEYKAVDRETAIKVIDLAIKMIKRDQEKARLQVLQDLDFEPAIEQESVCA